ncbi:MAG TPA: hypothetical protein VIH76_01055 [Candidatus Acidoferrales bacterium]
MTTNRHCLFEAKENRLSITATDLELSIRTSSAHFSAQPFELMGVLDHGELVGMSKENFAALPEFPHALVHRGPLHHKSG